VDFDLVSKLLTGVASVQLLTMIFTIKNQARSMGKGSIFFKLELHGVSGNHQIV